MELGSSRDSEETSHQITGTFTETILAHCKLEVPFDSTHMIVFLGVEAGLEGREVVGRLAGREDEVLFPDSAPPLPVVGGHLSDDRRHLGFLSDT